MRRAISTVGTRAELVRRAMAVIEASGRSQGVSDGEMAMRPTPASAPPPPPAATHYAPPTPVAQQQQQQAPQHAGAYYAPMTVDEAAATRDPLAMWLADRELEEAQAQSMLLRQETLQMQLQMQNQMQLQLEAERASSARNEQLQAPTTQTEARKSSGIPLSAWSDLTCTSSLTANTLSSAPGTSADDFDYGSRLSSLFLTFVGARPQATGTVVPSAIQPPERSTVKIIHSSPAAVENITPPVESHPDADLREKAVLELSETETTYVADLGIVVHTILPPIRAQEILTPLQISDIFCNIEAIYGFHKILLSELYDTSVGECFVKMCQYLKLYSVYLANQQKQSDTINTLLRTNKVFEKFHQAMSRRPEMRKLDLLSFLIKPLQRLCRYPLLLKEIIKYSPTDNSEYPMLLQAYTKISTIVESINEFARTQDNQTALWKVHAFVTDENGSPVDLMIPSRRLIKHGLIAEHAPGGALVEMFSGNKQEVQYFLFNDILLRAQTSLWSSRLVMKSLTTLNCLAVLTVGDTIKATHGIPLDKHCIWLEGYYSKDLSKKPLWQATLIFITLPERDSWLSAFASAICEYTPVSSSSS